jgi:hypothetical protein
MNLKHLGFCNIMAVYACYAPAFLMNAKHYLHRFFSSFFEEALQNFDYELHRGVVVVQ